MSSWQEIKDLKELDQQLEGESMRGLWTSGEELFRAPKPFGAPHLWKWPNIREGLDVAGRLIPTNYKGARRVLQLVHPNLPHGTSNTIGMAVQLVKAGEAVYSHRHTAAAMRFIIEGSKDVYTITNGEKCVMERGDMLIQPNWGWHNHVNETEKDAVWIDCLDVGLMGMLRTMFQEPHPGEDVKLFNSPVDNAVRNPTTLAPPGKSVKKLVFKWGETLPALEGMLPEDKSPYDGRLLEYRNPNGGPTFPTFSCWIQMLEGGEETVAHRHTANHLYHVFQGQGVTEAEGKKVEWEQGDFFVIPNWSWHRHVNGSKGEPAILFSNTDRPLLEAMGLYREESQS